MKAPKAERPQSYYDAIKKKFAEERDLRLNYRPEGTSQYTSDLSGSLARYAIDTFGSEVTPREAINDTVECLFIGGGFSALLTSARLRERGVESIRIVERGADVGGTWYWNRYPGVACDVVAYDYLPLLDEMDYVPKDHYAKGPEIFAHCQAIARKYKLYELATFQTTVTSTVWNEAEQMWDNRNGQRRSNEGAIRHLRQRNFVQTETRKDQRDGDLQRPFISHLAVGLRVHET
ncbi:MAG: NAD(P)-binding protein [Candidatus Binataceae bacterium]